ncbi:MAG: hypothetical protein L0Y64_19255, partial [Myxococcaceae bacterium]|nr:hypothetical protein [Myxococcaceae bacterium]
MPLETYLQPQPAAGNNMAPDGVALSQPPGLLYWVPDTAARERLERYRRADAALDSNQHADLHQLMVPGQRVSREFWIGVDLPGALGRIMRHYVFTPDFRLEAIPAEAPEPGEEPERAEPGEEPEAKEEAQKTIDRIAEVNRLVTLMRRVAQSLSA